MTMSQARSTWKHLVSCIQKGQNRGSTIWYFKNIKNYFLLDVVGIHSLFLSIFKNKYWNFHLMGKSFIHMKWYEMNKFNFFENTQLMLHIIQFFSLWVKKWFIINRMKIITDNYFFHKLTRLLDWKCSNFLFLFLFF